ncbi:hypothetical protein MMC14_001568 [Varicellaria rhodocarpa]|nr:hypothetical protein [Varicellaria rhodocarpa]
MLHARLFKETAKFREHHFQPIKAGLASIPEEKPREMQWKAYLDGNPAIDRPLFVQFCANDPTELLDAARYVQPFCDAIDLNLGCPQGIARKGKYGAFLQEDQDLIYRLINSLHRELDVPVTAKIRILETKEQTLEYAKRVLSAGASILAVHGRHREQKGHKTGLADWTVLRYLRDNLPPDTVLFANGNILRHEDISTCLDKTGADGVMSAEGNLCDPTIFSESPAVGQEDREYWRGKNGKGGYRMDAVFRRYLDVLYQYVLEKPPPERKPLFALFDRTMVDTNETVIASVDDQSDGSPPDGPPPAKKQKRETKQPRTTSPNLLAIQPHLFRLLRPLVSKHTHVRDALAKSHGSNMAAYENVLQLVEKATQEGLLDYEAHPENYEEREEPLEPTRPEESTDVDYLDYESSLAAVRACKRPWWVCQPYVRPLPREALDKGSLTLSKKDRQKLEEDKAKAAQTQAQSSAREELDVADGMEKAEMPKEAMVCG